MILPLIPSQHKSNSFRVRTTLSGDGAASTSGELTPNDSNSGFPLFPANVASGPAILTPENDENFIDPQANIFRDGDSKHYSRYYNSVR